MKSIVESIRKKLDKNFTYKNVQVTVKDPLPNSIKIKKVIDKVFKKVPSHLLSNLDVIYVGKFKELEDRSLQAMYKNSAIFITNEQSSVDDMLDDLIHEIAHSIEEQYESIIYGDLKLEKEFINKRKQLWDSLRSDGYDVNLEDFLETKFNNSLDQFLYAEIGYPVLSLYSSNLFYSPYGCTSLREYFANGFEAFFMREEVHRLKKISPMLYTKLVELLQLEKS